MPFLLLVIRTFAREEFDASPANLVYRENLRFPGELVLDKRDGFLETGLLRLVRDAVLKLKRPSTTLGSF